MLEKLEGQGTRIMKELTWMFCSGTSNARIKQLHERALQLV